MKILFLKSDILKNIIFFIINFYYFIYNDKEKPTKRSKSKRIIEKKGKNYESKHL